MTAKEPPAKKPPAKPMAMQRNDNASPAEAMGTAIRKFARRLKPSVSKEAAMAMRKAALKKQRKGFKPG